MDPNLFPKHLGGFLERGAEKNPEKLVFTYLLDGEERESTATYRELDGRARGIAAELKTKTRPGDRALLVFPPGLDFIAGLFGCLYAGLVAVPVFPPQPGKLRSTLGTFQKLACDAQAQVVLCDQLVYSKRKFLGLLAKGLKGVHWFNVTNIPAADPGDVQIHPGQSSDTAFILYTSGSTGDPTGVVLTHQNAIGNFKGFDSRVQASGVDPSQERGFSWLPPYHVAGLFFGILYPIFLNCSNILMSPLDFLAKPVRWLRGISRYRSVLSGGPNFAYDYCVDQITPSEREGLDLSCWKFALNGSEAVRPLTLERFTETFGPHGFSREAFMPAYGLTETANVISFKVPGNPTHSIKFSKEHLARQRVKEAAPGDEKAQTLISNGPVFENLEMQIVDPESRLRQAPGRVGEIWLKGPAVSKGYWNKPAPNQRLFQARLADHSEETFFRTGDLGFLYRGELFISGRIKELIIIRGKNYFPPDIENAVSLANPVLDPTDIAAFSVEVNGEEQLVVTAECKDLKKLNPGQLIGHIRETLSKEFSLQAYGVFLLKKGALPRTGTLKIRRGACRDLFIEGKLKPKAHWVRDRLHPISPPTAHREMISLPQTEEELEIFFRKKVASQLGIPISSLDFSQSLPHYGLDSLSAVELSHFLESNLKIRLGIGILFESPDLHAVFQEVKNQWRQVQSGRLKIPEKPDLIRESVLPETLVFSSPVADAENRPVFLTGATGFLGAFLLDQLLQETQSDIYCLVRSKTPEEGANRLRKNLRYFSLWEDSRARRIHPVPGDLSKPYLGLGEGPFQDLARKIGSIYHCGANVNFIFSYWDLKPANVGGTLEVLRLAGTETTKPLHYISTVGIFPVCGNEEGKAYNEKDAPALWEGHFSGYAQTKWVAERLVHKAAERGLPTTIYRVGEVIGHSQTGICKPDKDAYSNLLKGALLMGEAPRLNLNVYFAPVDMVARGVVYLSRNRSHWGKTFHLFLNPIQGTGLIQLLNGWQKKLELKPYEEFLKDMEELNREIPGNPLAPFMPLIRSQIVMEISKSKSLLKLNSKKTLKELKKGSIPTPPVKTAFNTYLRYLEKSGFLQ